MAKFQFALVLLIVAFAVMGCEARGRARPVRLIQRSRKLARQEVEEPVTPYPSADELKPEVPFEETFPVEEPVAEDGVVSAGSEPVPDEAVPEVAVPEVAITDAVIPADEVIPDEVYGPPEVAIVYNTPDEVYGPPEVDVNALTADVAFARQRALKARKARLVLARRQAAYRQAKLAKLRAIKKTKA